MAEEVWCPSVAQCHKKIMALFLCVYLVEEAVVSDSKYNEMKIRRFDILVEGLFNWNRFNPVAALSGTPGKSRLIMCSFCGRVELVRSYRLVGFVNSTKK